MLLDGCISTGFYFPLFEGVSCSSDGESYMCSCLASGAAEPSVSSIHCRHPSHNTTTRGARSHNGFASAAHEETAQGWCPCCCMNSAWILSPTWADLWRCWNASFQYKKVLSLYSARMEGIWHLTTSHNNRALCLSHVFPFLDVDAKPKFTWPNKDVYSAGVCIWTGHVSLSLQLMEKTRFFYWAHAINTYLKEVKRTRCF